MTRIISALALTAFIGCSHGFTSPSAFPQQRFSSALATATVGESTEILSSDEVSIKDISHKLDMEQPAAENVVTKKAPAKKAAKAGHGSDGPLAPFVIMTKKVLGEQELNQLRGKVIGLHSEVIGNFVDTHDTAFGELMLKTLFELADEDKSGTIEEEELARALRALGFRHLKDKQIGGIFARADKDSNGGLDYEEWKQEAPKTLRTNLIKLAKTNGGELGFLA